MIDYILSIIADGSTYYLLFNIVYYVTSLILFLVDYYRLFIDSKVNETNEAADMMATYKKTIPNVVFNTSIALILPAILIAISKYGDEREFSYQRCAFDILISILLLDIFFYMLHRLFHIPALYKRFHKKHHEILSPVGFSSLYMTITDFYFGNLLPGYLPMFIVGAHPITIKIWIVMAILNTILLAHSGYWVANYHDKHHSLFNKNYGANIFMDKLLGTYSV